jgi:hypothetical protein
MMANLHIQTGNMLDVVIDAVGQIGLYDRTEGRAMGLHDPAALRDALDQAINEVQRRKDG